MNTEKNVGILVIILVLVVVAISMIISCDHTTYPYEETLKKEYDSVNVNKVKIKNTSGIVEVKKWDLNTIEVKAIKKAWFKSDFDYVDIDISTGSTLKVESKYEYDIIDISVDYEVRVPLNMIVEVQNIDGSVDIDGVTYVDEVDVENGRIVIQDCDYVKNVEVENGSVDIEILKMNDNVLIKITNGSLDIAVEKNIFRKIETDVVNGNVEYNGISRNGNGDYDINVKITNGSADFSNR